MFHIPVCSRGSDSSGYSSGKESQYSQSSLKFSQIFSPKPDRGFELYKEVEPFNGKDLEDSIEPNNSAMYHPAKSVDGKYKTYSMVLNCGVEWNKHIWLAILKSNKCEAIGCISRPCIFKDSNIQQNLTNSQKRIHVFRLLIRS